MATDVITTSDPVIASYDYLDLTEGQGYVLHYLYAVLDSGGGSPPTRSHALSTNRPYSYDVQVNAQDSQEFNFKTGAFNLPKIIDGLVLFDFQMYVHSGQENTFTLELRRVKTDDSEDLLGSWNSGSLTGGGSGSWIKFLASITVSNAKIKVGEKINLKFVYSTSNRMHIGISPQDRDGEFIKPSDGSKGITSVFSVFIPYRINR
jgi:hypothetical protein